MRPVGTASSCQSGSQGPALRHRVSVSTPWVSSSRNSATSAVRGPGAAQAPGLPQARGCAHPRTPAHSGGAFPSLRPSSWATWLGSRGMGCAPPEATWYQSLSSQVGAASCRTGERRAAVAVSLPRCVPTATYQPGQPRGQEMGREAQRAGDSMEPHPDLTKVSAQSVVRAQPWPLWRGPCAVSEPAVARSADVPPATGVPLEVTGEGGAQAGRSPVVTWEGRGSGGVAARVGPAAAPLALAHRTAPRRGSPCSHTQSCTRPRGGSCSGWGPRPSRGTLLPAETARWPGVGRPRCSPGQRPLRVRHPGTCGGRAKRLCREGARKPRRTAPRGPCQGPGEAGCQDGVPGCARDQPSPTWVPPQGGPEPSTTREGLRPRPPSLHPERAGLGSLPQRGRPQDPKGSPGVRTAGRPGPTSLLPCRPSSWAPCRSCFRSPARQLTQEHDHGGQEMTVQRHGQARGREAWGAVCPGQPGGDSAWLSARGPAGRLCSDCGPGSALSVSAALRWPHPMLTRTNTWL